MIVIVNVQHCGFITRWTELPSHHKVLEERRWSMGRIEDAIHARWYL